MVVTTRVERALFRLLSGDQTLLLALVALGAAPDAEQLVWKGLAPPSVPLPYVLLVDMQAGSSESGGCGDAFLVRCTYQVKVVAGQAPDGGDVAQDLEAAADRIDALLSGWRGTEGVYRICARDVGPVNYSEGAAQGGYTHLGGLYEFDVTRGG
jgi:hypothetical protein